MQSGAMMMNQAQMGGMGGMGGGLPPEMMGGVMQAASGAIGGAMPMATNNTRSML